MKKIKEMSKKSKYIIISVVVLSLLLVCYAIYSVTKKEDNKNKSEENDIIDIMDKNDNTSIDISDIDLNFELNNDEKDILNVLLGDWGMCISSNCYGIKIYKDDSNIYYYNPYQYWTGGWRSAKVLSGIKKISENKYEIIGYYPATSEDSIYGEKTEKIDKITIDISNVTSNIIVINNTEYEKITTTSDEFYNSKINNVVKDDNYVYNNEIDIAKITETELKRIINKELYLLLNKNSLNDLNNQEKLRMLYLTYKTSVNNVYNGFYKKDLESVHKNGVLNSLNIEYTDINDYGNGGLREFSEVLHKLNKDTNQYSSSLTGHGDLPIFYESKLVDFKQENNRYIVSYKYVFGKRRGDGPSSIDAYKTVEDAIKSENIIKSFELTDDNNELKLSNEFKKYVQDNYEKLKNDLKIYTYVFEVKNNKLTLTDFYRQ